MINLSENRRAIRSVETAKDITLKWIRNCSAKPVSHTMIKAYSPHQTSKLSNSKNTKKGGFIFCIQKSP